MTDSAQSTSTEIINYGKEYIQSLLSYLAYINVNGKIINNIQWSNFIYKPLPENKEEFYQNYKTYLLNKFDQNSTKVEREISTMSSSIDLFINNFKIIRQITNSVTGFSATTYELMNDLPLYDYLKGDIFVAFRGTEPSEWADLRTDAKLIFITNFNYADYQTQQINALKYVNETYAELKKSFYLTGHSLGGHLAAITLLKLETDLGSVLVHNMIRRVSVFNPAGISVFVHRFNGKEISGLITNYFSVRGVNFVTANKKERDRNFMYTTFEHLGKRQPVYTEDAGGGDNHDMSLLVKAFGVYSTLESLVLKFPDSASDLNDDTPDLLSPNESKIYSFERLLMTATYKTGDEGVAINSLAAKIIDGFGLSKDLLIYSNPVSDFIHLKKYFETTPSLKIKIMDIFNNINHVNTNNNRSCVYSLLNDLPYVLIAPESYDKGLFFKYVNTTNKDIYNPENYSSLYFDSKIRFNRVYLEMMERKIILDIKGSYSVIDSTTPEKFVYVNNLTNFNSSSEKLLIYVNTTPSEEGDLKNTKHVEFKNLNNMTTNIGEDNTLFFDTASQDYINVYSNKNTIHLMNGNDYLVFSLGVSDNTVVVHPTVDILDILNYSRSLNSVTIDLSEVEKSPLIFKIIKLGQVDYGVFRTENIVELKYGHCTINISGFFNLKIGDKFISFKEIFSVLFNFKELFNNNINYDYPEIDNNFIDDYIQMTSIKYGQMNIDDMAIRDYTKITKDHVDFVVSKLTAFQGMFNMDISGLINYAKSKEYKIALNFSTHSTVTPIINNIKELTSDSFFIESLSKKLEKFPASSYTSFEDIDIEQHLNMSLTNNLIFYPIYRKKETKVYVNRYDDKGEKYWVWEGEYTYNHELNGIKLTGNYGGFPFGAKPINYYRKHINIFKNYSTIYGSDGSDILIANQVNGQSISYGDSGSIRVGDVSDRQNGDDILIGNFVTATSGNNLLISHNITQDPNNGGRISGGNGNDTFIVSIPSLVYINGTDALIDSNSNQNTVFLLANSTVYSSNAKNIVIHKGLNNSSEYSSFYATGNDTYVGAGSFIGGKEAYQFKKPGNTPKNNDLNSVDYFYEKYSNNQGINHVYATNNEFNGVLGSGDYADLSLGHGKFYGIGSNNVIIGDNYTFYSGGNSLITIKGSNNIVYLGHNDIIENNQSNNNTFYSFGFESNMDLPEISDSYFIKGTNNLINLGSSLYHLSTKGHNNRIIFTKNNINDNVINIDDFGVTELFIDAEKTISSIDMETKSKVIVTSYNEYKENNISSISELSLTGSGELELDSIFINDFKTLTSNDLYIKNSRLDQIDLETTAFVKIEKSNLDTVVINSESTVDINDSVINKLDSSSKKLILNKATIQEINLRDKHNLVLFNAGDVSTDFNNDIISINSSTADIVTMDANSDLNINDSIISEMSISANKVNVFKSKLTKLKVNNSDLSSITGATIDNLIIDAGSDFNIIDSSVTDLKINTTNQVNIYLENVPNIENLSVSGVYGSTLNYENYNNQSKKIKHISINNMAFTGIVKSNESFTHDGLISYLDFKGLENISLVNINGFIKNGTFTDLKEFTYNNTSTDNEYSTINIRNSEIVNLKNMTTMTNTHLNVSGSDAIFGDLLIADMHSSTLDITGKFNSVNLTDTIIDSSFNIKGKSDDSIDINIGKMNIKSSRSHFDIFHDGSMCSLFIATENTVFGQTAGTIEISGENDKELSIRTHALQVLISNTTNAHLIDARGDTVEIDLDSVDGIVDLSMKPFFLKLKTSNDIIVTKNKIGDYILTNDDFITNKLELTVFGNVYNQYEIAYLRTRFKDSNDAYATITSTGIEFTNVPALIDNELYFDEKLIYQGTANNDNYILDGKGPYIIQGNKGNDVYNFTNYNNYSNHIIKYYIGDGYDTVNSVGQFRLILKLEDIHSTDLKFTSVKNAINQNIILNIFYLDEQIFTINNYANTTLELHTIDKITFKGELENALTSIYGTSGDDVINTLYISNYIYPGKGNDIINISSAYGINEIYYNLGDGHDTINSENDRYTVVFNSSIDKNLITYELHSVTGIFVKYGGDIILTINQPNNGELKFLSTNEVVRLFTVYTDLTTLFGTDNDDIITVDSPITVKAKGGNDIINVNITGANIYTGSGNNVVNINYTDTNSFSTVFYENGGVTTINLLDSIFNTVKIYLDRIPVSKFEYDKDNHDTLNIYYTIRLGATPVKFMVIKNYRKVIWETFTSGRAEIYNYYTGGVTGYYHTNIDKEAEKNYQLLIKP